MPWRDMEQERLNFINKALDPTEAKTFGNLCEEFGISRKTGYKWLERYQQRGLEGLKDQSKAALKHPHKISSNVIQHVINIRIAYNNKWGPKKIHAEMQKELSELDIPSVSSIANILRDCNLSKPRTYRRHVAKTAPLVGCFKPNDVWMYDFKGYFKTGDGSICEPLTITDGFSRYLIRCEHMKRKRTQDVWEVLEGAFYEYGLPTRMRSDNGPPFATTGVGRLSPLAIKLIKAGVTPEWIEPGHPEQNGRHERFHLTLKNEIATPPAASLKLQILEIEQFENYYNNIRPHEVHEQVPPGHIYKPSERQWNGKLQPIEYDIDFDVRKVCKGGTISWMGQVYFLSESLYGENVGIKELDIGVAGVYYGTIMLGNIDFKKGFKRK